MKGDVFLPKKIRFFCIIIVLAAVILGTQKIAAFLYENVINEEELEVTAKAETIGTKIVIDSGHGGMDPGKVGINGVLEKDINLKIAVKLKEILENKGIEVVMTRENDEGLADSKTEDMRERINIINQNAPVLCVSIHQNSYGDEAIHGAQVFYYTHSEQGEQIAEIIQQALLVQDPDNTRQKKANDTYYILMKSEVPTVIVECGFLSNRAEADLLNTDEYQQKIAEAVAKGILEYLTL